MKHATWFRLLLRAVGVGLVAYSVQWVVALLLLVLQIGAGEEFDEPMQFWEWLSYLGPLLQFALGLYLFFNPKWLMKVCIDDITYCCPACRFDLRGLAAPLACPECGVRLPGDIPPPPLPGTSEPGSTSAKGENSHNLAEEPSGPVA